MKSVIFDKHMILDLMTTGTAVKLSKVKPRPDTGLIWGGWILDSTSNEKDIGKGLWLDQYPLSIKEVRVRCPHGGVGDVLRVRETWRPEFCAKAREMKVVYRAGGEYIPEASAKTNSRHEPAGWELVNLASDGGTTKWRPSTQMPSWASRYTVQCTAVSVEQINGQWHWRNEYALVKEA